MQCASGRPISASSRFTRMRALLPKTLSIAGEFAQDNGDRTNWSAMALTADLVSLSLRIQTDSGPDPARIPLSEGELQTLSERLLYEAAGDPLWVFAYGSLIWKPDFDAVDWCHAQARGWHRSFCLQMTQWRATDAVPGLMMTLDRGGQCNGVAYRLSEENRMGEIRRMIRREVGSLSDSSSLGSGPNATEALARADVLGRPQRQARPSRAAARKRRDGAGQDIWPYGVVRRISLSHRQAPRRKGHSRSQPLAAAGSGRRGDQTYSRAWGVTRHGPDVFCPQRPARHRRPLRPRAKHSDPSYNRHSEENGNT